MGLLSDIFVSARLKRVRYLADVGNMKICKAHKEWKKLTAEEKRACRCCGDDLMFYKNMWPGWEGAESAKYFVSEGFYQAYILPVLAPINYGMLGIAHVTHYISDKNYQDVVLGPELKFNENCIKNISGEFYDSKMNHITREEAMQIMNSHDRLVFKRTLGFGHGTGVLVADKKDFQDVINKWGSNYQAQKLIKQSSILSYFNESSVNILRLHTVFWKGQVYYLGGILRVGAPGAFLDLLSKSELQPLTLGINDDGTFQNHIVDLVNGKVVEDVFGKKVQGQLPDFPALIEKLKRLHLKLPHNKIIGWDITLDENDEYLCVEFNTGYPAITRPQLVIGPIFAAKTVNGVPLLDEILEEVNKHKAKSLNLMN